MTNAVGQSMRSEISSFRVGYYPSEPLNIRTTNVNPYRTIDCNWGAPLSNHGWDVYGYRVAIMVPSSRGSMVSVDITQDCEEVIEHDVEINARSESRFPDQHEIFYVPGNKCRISTAVLSSGNFDLTYGAEVVCRVNALNIIGTSNYGEGNGAYMPSPPEMPVNLGIVAGSRELGSVVLTWMDPGQQVHESEVDSSSWHDT